MIPKVTLPLLLARAKRNRRPIQFFFVRSLDEVAAVIEAAEITRKPASITIDATKPLPYSLSTFVALSKELLSRSSSYVALTVATNANHHSVNYAISQNVDAVLPLRLHESKEQYAALLTWALRTTEYSSVHIILDLGSEYEEVSYFASLGLRDIAAVRVDVMGIKSGKYQLRGLVLDEIASEFRLPLLAADHSEALKHSKKYHTRRIAALENHSGLSEAFSAGVRTALHNRELSDPSRFIHKGRKAAVQYALQQMEYVCTT